MKTDNELNAELIEAGREWLLEIFNDISDRDVIENELSPNEIMSAIKRYYSGGWSAFENNFELSNEYRNA